MSLINFCIGLSRYSCLALSACASVSVGHVAYAQPPQAGDLLQQITPQPSLLPNMQALPQVVVPRIDRDDAAAAAAASATGEGIEVTRFEITGNVTVFSAQALQDVLAPFRGAGKGLDDLQAAAAAVTRAYAARGFALAQALLPAQEVANGVIRIHVLEGLMQAGQPVNITGGHERVSPDDIRAVFDTAMPQGQPVSQQAAERAVLLLGDLYGLRASLSFAPGVNQGELLPTLKVAQTPTLSGSVGVSNSGSFATGRAQMQTQFNWSNPWGYGERVGLELSAAPQYNSLQSVKLSGVVPVGYQGWTVGASYSDLNYRVIQAANPVDAKGEAQVATLTASYPLRRTLANSITWNVGLSNKRTLDKALGQITDNKRIDSLQTDLTWQGRFGALGDKQSSAQLQFTAGKLDLSRVPDKLTNDQAAGGLGTNGSFSKLNWRLGHSQSITTRTSWSMAAAGQMADGNLDASEKFQLGGAQTMRGYPTGETSGDQGWRINASITHTLGNTGGWQWRTSAFADHGYIEKQHTPQAGSTTLNAYHLTSVGLGLSAQHNNGLRASLTIGHKLGSNPAANQTTGADADGRLSTDRVWLELGYTF